MTAEIYPTAIRATAQGFTYNAGRLAFFLAAISLYWVPDPRSVDLREI